MGCLISKPTSVSSVPAKLDSMHRAGQSTRETINCGSVTTVNCYPRRWLHVCGRPLGSPAVPLILIGRRRKSRGHKWQAALQALPSSGGRPPADSSQSGSFIAGMGIFSFIRKSSCQDVLNPWVDSVFSIYSIYTKIALRFKKTIYLIVDQ